MCQLREEIWPVMIHIYIHKYNEEAHFGFLLIKYGMCLCTVTDKYMCLLPLLTDHHFKATPLPICSSVIPVKWHLKVWKRKAPAETERGGRRAAKGHRSHRAEVERNKGIYMDLCGPVQQSVENAWNPAVGPELLLIKAIYLPLLFKNTTGFTAQILRKKRAQKEAKSTQSWIRPKMMMRCFKSMLKTSPPYIPVLVALFWTNWLLLTLSEYPWPSVWVPVTKKYWASNGPCFHNRLSNTAFDYKVKNALKKGGITPSTMVTTAERSCVHTVLANVLICPIKTRTELRVRLSTAVPDPSPVSFPIASTQKKTMAGSVHNHFMMQMTTVDLSGTPNAEEAF